MVIDNRGMSHKPKGLPRRVAGTYEGLAAATGDADLDTGGDEYRPYDTSGLDPRSAVALAPLDGRVRPARGGEHDDRDIITAFLHSPDNPVHGSNGDLQARMLRESMTMPLHIIDPDRSLHREAAARIRSGTLTPMRLLEDLGLDRETPADAFDAILDRDTINPSRTVLNMVAAHADANTMRTVERYLDDPMGHREDAPAVRQAILNAIREETRDLPITTRGRAEDRCRSWLNLNAPIPGSDQWATLPPRPGSGRRTEQSEAGTILHRADHDPMLVQDTAGMLHATTGLTVNIDMTRPHGIITLTDGHDTWTIGRQGRILTRRHGQDERHVRDYAAGRTIDDDATGWSVDTDPNLTRMLHDMPAAWRPSVTRLIRTVEEG